MMIILVQQGVRKVPVQYARRIVGRKVYGGQNTYLPLKINTAGVIPIIFAQSIILIPGTIATFFGTWGIPAFTTAFCLVASVFVLLQGSIYGAIAVEITRVTTSSYCLTLHGCHYTHVIMCSSMLQENTECSCCTLFIN